MNVSSPQREIDSRSWRSLDCLLLLILAAVSTYNFTRRGPTAFEWPGTDMACFYERLADPNFLPNDYYTNSIVAPNPRHVFGYFVVALARLFHTDWYSIYFAIRVVQTLAVPMLWYLAMLGLLNRYLSDDRRRLLARLVLASAVVLVMRRDVSAWFSIAWWPPYFQYVGAHPFAILLGLVGIVLRAYATGPARYFSVAIWFCASLIHPAIGIFMVAFYVISEIGNVSWRESCATFAFGALLPAAILSLWYRPESPLPAPDFVNLYVASSHPFHYQVSQFATLTRYPWWVSFALVLGLMIGSAIVGVVRRDAALARLGVLFSASYAGCVVLQYAGTDVWPSRAIAALGPSRFSFLGFYMVAMLSALAICGSQRPQANSLLDRARRSLANLRWLQPRGLTLAVVAAAVCMVAVLKDDLHRDVRAKYQGLYDWIEQNTAPDDIFLTTFNHALHKQLPVIGQRALFASQTFPFREEMIPEHIRRLNLAYGTAEKVAQYPGRDQIARRTNYFRALSPMEILALARADRLDFVIVESDHCQNFAGFHACYADDSVAVYSIRDLLAATQRRSGPNPPASVTSRHGGRSALQ